MSGIAGIIHFDGKPIEPGLIEKMTGAMAHRGPDGVNHWVKGSVALGQCMLRTAIESRHGQQPLSFDGQIWLVADARIDDRDGLKRKFKAHGRLIEEVATDADLILHAYHAWGYNCVQHLMGDFAFAIWDYPARKFFCARDHFGIKPFYYAVIRQSILFASDIRAIFGYPEFPKKLNDLAIADFLLFGYNDDDSTTFYRNIRQLKPAHMLTAVNSETHIECYWTLPEDSFIYYPRPADYIQHFRDVFTTAVIDRLRTSQIGIFLSGGLDSSSVAGIAATQGRKKIQDLELVAYTVTANRLCPEDQEGYYAGIVARSLDIPITLHPLDDCPLFDRWEQVASLTQAPVYNPFHANHLDLLQQIRSDGVRVVLSGEGGDPIMLSSPDYYKHLLLRLRWKQLWWEIRGHMMLNHSLRGMGLRSWFIRQRGNRPWTPQFPAWLEQNFVARYNLIDRWKGYYDATLPADGRHDRARQDLTSMAYYMDRFRQDEGDGADVEICYPFFDVRIIKFILSIPVCLTLKKSILRHAVSDILPETIARRPKTPFPGDLIRTRLVESSRPDHLDLSLENVGDYVCLDKLQNVFESYRSTDNSLIWPWDSIMLMAPFSLSGWLKNISSVS